MRESRVGRRACAPRTRGIRRLTLGCPPRERRSRDPRTHCQLSLRQGCHQGSRCDRWTVRSRGRRADYIRTGQRRYIVVFRGCGGVYARARAMPQRVEADTRHQYDRELALCTSCRQVGDSLLRDDRFDMIIVPLVVYSEMVKQQTGGSIVFTASISAHSVNFPQPQVAYNVSKGALLQLRNSLAAEWARYGIRVNSISPGYMDTVLNHGSGLEEARRVWASRNPIGRMGDPAELTGAVVLLCSRAGRYINGADITVDGEPKHFSNFVPCILC